MLTSDFDFHLPPELIAQHPVEPRDRARLMVLRPESGSIAHHQIADLPELLRPGDRLVRNNSRVVPARLVGRRETTGGAWEGLFLRARPDGSWEILAKTRGRPNVGEKVLVGDGRALDRVERPGGCGGVLDATAERPRAVASRTPPQPPRVPESGRLRRGLSLVLVERLDGGRWVVRPEGHADASPFALLDRFGQIPLPPYIRKGREGPGDRVRYQTTFAAVPGSVAAPTAGLHFTPELFDRLEARGVGTTDLTLHVGIGTFRPIEADRVEDHTLHAEWAELSPEAAGSLNDARARGGRVVAVGTTSARTLESAVAPDGSFRPFVGETALYLKPGHEFRGLDALLTNFHLPRSSLLVLVSALAGVEFTRAAYEEAIERRYRFYSYGDAMLILP